MACRAERWTVTVLAGMVWIGVAGLGPSSAEACSPLGPVSPMGLPRSGSVGVSTATSLLVLSQGQPAGLTLQAAGQNVPLSAPVDLGAGADGARGGLSFWQVRAATPDGMLPASAEQVLTASYQGNAVEVTRFTTAAGYDKAEGVAPVLNAVHLWRVRYPVADIASGNCVFDEYTGFLTVDYTPGTVPNTAASSVVHTFQLRPKNGSSVQTFIYTGDTPFAGNEPTGAYPMPTGLWQPELDPTRSYCLTIGAFGDGDIARLPLSSNTVCADVVQLSAAGAPPPPTIGGGTSGGGCSVSGRADATSGAWMLLCALVVIGARRRA
jgi:hypothetical protein